MVRLYGTLTFGSEPIPSLGHNEQLISVFSIFCTSRENAALCGVASIFMSLFQTLSLNQVPSHISLGPRLIKSTIR